MSKGTPQFFERSQKKNDLIIYDVDIRSKTFPIASSNDLTCETGAYKIIEINKYKCIIGWGNSHSGDHVNIRCRFFLFVIKKHRRVIEKSEWRGLPLPVDSSIKPKGNHPPDSIREHSSVAKLASRKMLYLDTG